MTHYFIIQNRNRTTDRDWFHYFTIESDSFQTPEYGWMANNIVAHTTDPKCHEALQRFFTNSHMRDWLEANGGRWPVNKGWH